MANWIDSNGGPLLLLPLDLLGNWGGIEPPKRRVVKAEFRWNPDGPATDYDRACDVKGYLGNIDVGAGHALVLGDEPMPTTFLPAPTGGVLVRWVHAETEKELLTAIQALESFPNAEDTGFLQWPEGPLVLFDSACPGTKVGADRLLVDLPPVLAPFAVDQAAVL